MSTYKEKLITMHLVQEYGNDDAYYENYWFELRVDDIEISKGDTLEEAIRYCPATLDLNE